MTNGSILDSDNVDYSEWNSNCEDDGDFVIPIGRGVNK